MKILAIIPAHNEEESIERVVENLRCTCPNLDILVVNDGSTDNTAAICYRNGYPLLNLATNLGLAGAFGAGMHYAHRHSYDAAIQFDADGQHRPEYIQPLADKLSEGYDIVIGSRFVSQKKPISMRMIGSFLISAVIKLTTKTKIKDPTSGMRIYSKRIISEFSKKINMTPEPDTVSYLIQRGAKIAEVQVDMDERTAGQSYLSFSRSINYMIRMAISILFVQWFRGGRKLEPVIFNQKGGNSI